ncbi:CLUMA_CG005660, isoform A [Clunio marinus]|uniref:CLUMA_CG005660, isoform A n=1 Tax=Clunio marinus TaxID=568069 RepID=A0A1J1HXM4_9DIPT|nr:CLUMA_CG005660, isoform A [Clunio marinus]
MESNFRTLLVLLSLVALGSCELKKMEENSISFDSSLPPQIRNLNLLKKQTDGIKSPKNKETFSNDVEEFENVLLEYAGDILNRKNITIMPGVYIEKISANITNDKIEKKSFEENLISSVKDYTSTHTLRIDMARALSDTGRLFFFKGNYFKKNASFIYLGLKKFMWPLFIGMQVVKTVLLVLFLPSIIGSVGRIVGKGLPSLSGTFSQFSQQNANIETIDDLEFKDNSMNSDHEAEGTINSAYQYNIPNSKNNNFVSQMYDAAQTNNALSQLGMDRVMNVDNINKNNGFLSKRDDFKVFHDIPSSSLLLTNYDPFYSPLLSRLDAVFQQLGLDSGKDESCREKLVCLMYSNPAKYAPYSNLVSAQLSRELNELRKPTSDNPDILRFFRYMRSAKDGQDGIDCEIAYKDCLTFNDMSGPAMINTFNEINKLVQARKL